MKQQHEHFDFGAFSFTWPILTFADSFGNIFVANCHDKTTINRIKLDKCFIDNDLGQETKESMKICRTFVSSKRNLYVLVLVNDLYKIIRANINK